MLPLFSLLTFAFQIVKDLSNIYEDTTHFRQFKDFHPPLSTVLNTLSLSELFAFFCGASQDRTDDPLRARQVLSQLSYGPLSSWWAWIDLNYRPHAYQACALTN